MNVYTITFHSAHNYGAVLQAYALQNYLIKINKDGLVACIDYRPDYTIPHIIHNRENENLIKWIAHNAITLPSRIQRKLGFDRFIEKNLSVVSLSDARTDNTAVLIAGSDQIWNKEITGGHLDSTFAFYDFSSKYKYSYAASIGSSKAEDIDEVAKEIKDLKYIGVREEDTVKELRNLGFENVVLNVDPVFLLEKEDYQAIVKPPIISGYIFVYTLETSVSDVKSKIKDAKKKYPDCKIISLGSYKNLYGSDIHYKTATPEEFLGLIMFAKCVITNSFHVTAFAVMFDKPIASIHLRNGRGGRIENLLNLIDFREDFSSYAKTSLITLIHDSKKYLQWILMSK